MIIFDLTCDLGHSFEGWFQSQEKYDEQLADGLISCPHCGSVEIRRVPSAVHVPRKTAGTPVGETQLPNTQEGMLSLLGKVLSAVISNTEDVGKQFAEEARRIHYSESPDRAIRGEASIDEFESLREEGIEVMMLPVMKKEEVH